ncbi:MAG: RNA polymerase sigma factor RpoE [Rhodoferax sp.]
MPDRPGLADPDAPIVARVVAGDLRAFDLLVIKYQRRIERLVGRMVSDADLVPDIAQEAFLRAYRALPKFRGESLFYTWLYRIAINTAKKALLGLKGDPLYATTDAQAADEDETFDPQREPSTDESPEALLAAKEIAQAVEAALQSLPEDLRQAIVLREVEGLSYEDIALAMGTPLGTVRSRIFRAREAISAKVRPLLERQSGKRW